MHSSRFGVLALVGGSFLTLSILLLFPRNAPAVMPTRSGTVPAEIVRAREDGLFELPAREGLPTSVATTTWNIPVLLVEYTDLQGTTTPGYYASTLFDTTSSVATGSLFDYYMWASVGRVHVHGEVVGWVRLPYDKAFYGNNAWGTDSRATPRNDYGAVFHALSIVDSSVDFSRYDMDRDGFVDMLWLVHAGVGGEATSDRNSLCSITSRMSLGWRFGGAYRTGDLLSGSNTSVWVDRFSILPELSGVRSNSPCEIGVFCHEFGHALGLPDLYDTVTLGGGLNAGPGYWSLMSTGAYGGDGFTPESPVHPGAWPALFLGWNNSFRPALDTLVALPALGGGGPVADFWFQGEDHLEHFLIENRQRLGFDRSLQGEGLLVYRVNESIMSSGLPNNRVNPAFSPGLVLVEADGQYDLLAGRNRGEPTDVFPGPLGITELDDDTTPSFRTSAGAPTNLAIRRVESIGDSMRVFLQVEPPGWASQRRWSSAAFDPLQGAGAGATAAPQSDGTLDAVWVDGRGGLRQVLARRKRLGAIWETELPVSDANTSVSDAAIAATGDGGWVAAWSELRDGAREIIGRAFLDGALGPPFRVSTTPGHSRQPALAVDDQRNVTVAWLEEYPERIRVLATTFLAGDPPGAAIALSDSAAVPRGPAVTVDAAGVVYVAWPDDRNGRNTVLYLRNRIPGEIWSAERPLVPSGSYDGNSVSMACDPLRRLHTVWVAVYPGRYELHYQRRDPGQDVPSGPLAEVALETDGEPISHPRLVAASDGALHLAYESLEAGDLRVRYRRLWPDGFWDAASTRLTTPTQGTSVSPTPLPGPDARVTVLWNQFENGRFGAMEKTRFLQPTAVVSVPVARAPPASMRLAPNPVRSGEPLALEPNAPAVEILDVAGRKIAEAETGPDGRARFAPGVTARWSTGIYFARARGASSRVKFVVLR